MEGRAGAVARRRLVAARKRRTREHVIADLCANHVERHALLCTFAVERTYHDYGVDLSLTTYTRRGDIESGLILIQLRATDRPKLIAGGSTFACRLERSHLAHWLDEPMPFILVLYDARKDVAYWLYLQAYFEAQDGFDLARAAQRITVPIPRRNVLDRAAMRRFARYKKAVLAQTRGYVHHAE
jgi:hypothetical protein